MKRRGTKQGSHRVSVDSWKNLEVDDARIKVGLSPLKRRSCRRCEKPTLNYFLCYPCMDYKKVHSSSLASHFEDLDPDLNPHSAYYSSDSSFD